MEERRLDGWILRSADACIKKSWAVLVVEFSGGLPLHALYLVRAHAAGAPPCTVPEINRRSSFKTATAAPPKLCLDHLQRLTVTGLAGLSLIASVSFTRQQSCHHHSRFLLRSSRVRHRHVFRHRFPPPGSHPFCRRSHLHVPNPPS